MPRPTLRTLLFGIAWVFFLMAASFAAVRVVAPLLTLEVNRLRWKAAGIEDYIFVYEIGCFCGYPANIPAVISVAGGQVVSVAREGDYLDTDSAILFPTIDDLFDRIQEEIVGLPAGFSVAYDSELGFPAEFRVDHRRGIADDEVAYSVDWIGPTADLPVIDVQSTIAAQCADPISTVTFSEPDSDVVVSVTGSELVILNRSRLPIYHEIFSEYILDLLEWGPCSDPSDCPQARIEPGATRSYQWQELFHKPENHFTVYWWLIDDPDTGEHIWPLVMGAIDIEFEGRPVCE